MVDWQDAVAAVLAPLALWLLWRVQRFAVLGLRWAMARMARHAAWLYHTVSWFGTLLHELGHAIVLLVSGLGIKDFSVRSEQGHVTPRRMPRTWLGSIGLILAAMAPMYFLPALVYVATILLLDPSLAPAATGTAAVGTRLWSNLVVFPGELVESLLGINVLDWRHAVLLAIIIVGAPGTRPSFVRGEGLLGDRGGSGDLAVVRGQIKDRPWLLAVGLGLLVAAYWLVVPWHPDWYWVPFQALFATTITGTVIALFGALLWWTVDRNLRIVWWLAWIPPALLVGVAIGSRFLLFNLSLTDLAGINALALAAWSASATGLAVLAPRRDRIDRAIRR